MKGTISYGSDALAFLASLLFVTFTMVFMAVMLFILNLNIEVKVYGDIIAGEETSGKLMLAFLNSGEGKSMKELFANAVATGTISEELKTSSDKMLSKLVVNKAGITQSYKLVLKQGDSVQLMAEEGFLTNPIVVEAPTVAAGKSATLSLEINKGWER